MCKLKLINESEIIFKISEGDESAFTQFFDHYKDHIYNSAYKLTHSHTIAQEIVSDVFLKIWLKRKDLKNIQNFSAYLFTIVRNDVYRILKNNAKNYIVSELTDSNCTSYNNQIENSLIDKEYNIILKKAISHLPNQQKRVYLLIKEQELKRETVADILSINSETVKFHLAQAMKSICSFCLPYLKIVIGLIILPL